MIASKINAFNVAGNTAMGGAAGGGSILWWLDNYSAGIGAVVVVFVFITGLVFHILNLKEKKRHNKEIEKNQKK